MPVTDAGGMKVYRMTSHPYPSVGYRHDANVRENINR
jgi:hypothetical protein